MSTVLLTSGTVGTVGTEVAVGDIVIAIFHDQNGLPVSEIGIVEEVLE